ncbi:hypothetical protein ACFPRL_11170 [Pseudoclavibacter helvolus]
MSTRRVRGYWPTDNWEVSLRRPVAPHRRRCSGRPSRPRARPCPRARARRPGRARALRPRCRSSPPTASPGE